MRAWKPAPGAQHNLEDDAVVVRIDVVTMPAPSGRVHMQLHVAAHGPPPVFQDGALEVRPRPGVADSGKDDLV